MTYSWKTSVWKNGNFFDLWHVNHFLAGVLLGCLAVFFSISLWFSLTISLVLFVSWEIFEIVKKIEETKFNSFFDVVFSVAAFLMIFYSTDFISTTALYYIFAISLFVWIFLELWGYYSYKILYSKKSGI